MARSTADYFPIQVLNTVLGGSFTSRLNNNLREVHGYTYGAGSSFDMRGAAGPFSASAGVQTDKTADALKEFFNELNAILKPVPADELARAKNYVSLRYPSAFETTGDVSRRLEDALVYKLPDDYFAKYVQNIQAVTAADVQRVAQKYIQPDHLAVVIVGDLKTIEPGVRALNLGPIKVMTIDDVFGPKPVSRRGLSPALRLPTHRPARCRRPARPRRQSEQSAGCAPCPRPPSAVPSRPPARGSCS